MAEPLSAVNAAPSSPTSAPPRDQREESDAQAFGAALARATSQREDQAKPRAARGDDASTGDGEEVSDVETDADMDAADSTPAIDPREHAAEVLATIAAPAPNEAALAHAAVPLAAAKSETAEDAANAAAVPAPVGRGAHARGLPEPAIDPESSRATPARKHEPAINDTPTPRTRGTGDVRAFTAATETQPIAPRDRLIEDFQQRFERALSAAVASPHSEPAANPSAIASLAAGAAPLSAPNGLHRIDVPMPVGAAAFGEDFSARIALLARGRVHSAELSLTPADLGPVSVSIELRGTEATLVFGAAHAATRAAIEDALPRLREMLDAQGLQLTDARVGTQTGDGASRDNGREAQPSPHAAAQPIEPAAAATTAPLATARPLRLIDVIA